MDESALCPYYKSTWQHSLKCEFYVNRKKKVPCFLTRHANFLMWTSGEKPWRFLHRIQAVTVARPAGSLCGRGWIDI
jgi:hypothetical protein